VGLARKERGCGLDVRGEGRAGEAVGEEASEGDLAETNAATAEEVASGDVEAVLLERIHGRDFRDGVGTRDPQITGIARMVAEGGCVLRDTVSPW
jgi:hypothetical protein